MFIERRNALVTGLREYLRKVFPGSCSFNSIPMLPRPDYPFVAFEPIVPLTPGSVVVARTGAIIWGHDSGEPLHPGPHDIQLVHL